MVKLSDRLVGRYWEGGLKDDIETFVLASWNNAVTI